MCLRFIWPCQHDAVLQWDLVLLYAGVREVSWEYLVSGSCVTTIHSIRLSENGSKKAHSPFDFCGGMMQDELLLKGQTKVKPTIPIRAAPGMPSSVQRIAPLLFFVYNLSCSESFQLQSKSLQYRQTIPPRLLPTCRSRTSFSSPCSALPQHQYPTTLQLSATTEITSKDDEPVDKKEVYKWTPQTMELAIPALVSMLADPLLSLMDTAYVGRVGPIELAALGACTSIFHLAFNAFRATTAATTSLVGNADTEEEKREIVNTSLSLGVVLGIVVVVTLQLAGAWCLRTMGVARDSPLFKPAIAYLSTRLFAAPAVLAIVVSEGAFRGYGDTKIPLVASMVASLINLVLDPILMFPLGLGVKGAAAATALAQLGAASTYIYFLRRRKMLPKRHAKSVVNKMDIAKTIMGANAAMVLKQGSLLLAWAYATARATRIGSAHVAAHQVALSCWLVSALVLDGVAVSAQVLISRCHGELKKMKSLVSYMFKFAGIQGLVTTLGLLGVSPFLPKMFTTDGAILQHLYTLMPQVAWQQLLVSLTLMTESLAVGGNQFKLLATGTTISTIFSMWQLRRATDVATIWSRGIVSLFVGRLITALIGTFRTLRQQETACEG